ncbi:MAG: glyoxylate/hydroxypyruvate reductase A [Paracoccaceae bacterium]
MPNILFADRPENWPRYEAPLRAALSEAGIAAQLVLPGNIAPEAVDYIVYSPRGPVQDFTPFTRTRAVLSLWAGVERVVGNPTLSQPLCRMVDDGLSHGMVEWVVGHALRYHLGIDFFRDHQDGIWRQDGHVPPLARERGVSVLGLGALGGACASALAGLGFRVTGWSRSAKALPGVTCLHGPEGLAAALARAEILVTLLPNTPDTTDLLDRARLAQLPRGAVVLNPGRGNVLVDAALLEALETGHLAGATLDVFRTEPLPADHPFWAHPKVTVTPHVAAETRPASAARIIAENIRRAEAGEPLLYLVDRARGY